MIPEAGAHLFFQGIKEIAPAYYVTGNHEYWSGEIDRLREMVTSYGVTILSDNYEIIRVHGQEILLAGVEDPAKRRYEMPLYDYVGSMERAFSPLREDDTLKILLAHRPEWIETYLGYPFDLVISGHAHGGQVRIPLLASNGLYAPNQGLFPSYTGGRYEHGAVVHIVSRGLAVYKERPRIYNRPELVVIKINNNIISSYLSKMNK
ncbi:metallophosphoesterase [Entomospira culicis]|uniref:metallophosphoesterase n=1 Tax=Entomospira culicis TaxID=2719989 RepID=UPI002368A6B5|nr:metallophosphoesterase [Entomospira culicis]WDI37963.1 hypothetical protein PVA46_03345 [Entomospira culicis]WDI39588.1 hypothetical protein PVA47_03350 [Entomospira culicis]